MFYRSLLAIGLMFGAATAEAAQVKSLVVKCIDRSEATNDDIFLAGVRDGQPVPWGKDHQPGTSVGNTANMTDGDVLTLDARSLAELKFDKTLQIVVNEKDVTANDAIGTVNITSSDGAKKVVLKGKDFEYHVEYKVE